MTQAAVHAVATSLTVYYNVRRRNALQWNDNSNMKVRRVGHILTIFISIIGVLNTAYISFGAFEMQREFLEL